MGEHYVKKCKKCKRIIEQCRCMDPYKTVIWVDECDICKENKQPRQSSKR